MNRQPHGRGKRPRRRQSKMAVPPTALAPMTKPSKRHPGRRPRCQRWRLVNGRVWQCSKAARAGFRVCGLHGAGYPKREQLGSAKNPALAALKNGRVARPETIEQLLRRKPELQALFDRELDGDLFDLRPQLAMAKVLARYFVEEAKLNDTDNSFGKTPPALAAIDALERVMEIAERLVKIEERLGPITHAELGRYVRGVAHTLLRFVPADQQEAAFTYMRSLAVQDGGEHGDPAADTDPRPDGFSPARRVNGAHHA